MAKKRTPDDAPKVRRVKGTGTVFFNTRRGVYVARVPVGKRPNGKTHYVSVSDRTQAGCVEKMRLARPPGPTTTVSEWATRWLDDLGLRDGTEAGYRSSVKERIGPELGHLRVAEVTPHHVEAAARKWLKAVGANTVRLTLAHLSACLGQAVRAGLIAANPCRAARKPAGVKKPIDPFTVAELHAIVAEAASRHNTRVVALLAATGLRVGEGLALDVRDWDATKGTVSVTKTVAKKGKKLGPPKSKHSTRVVRVPAHAVAAVRDAVGTRTTGPLFPTSRGNRSTYPLARTAWYALVKRLGLRPRNPHQLRHSVATHLIAAGVPIGNVAKYLGDVPATIVKTYLHPVAGVDPSEAMDRLFGGVGCR